MKRKFIQSLLIMGGLMLSTSMVSSAEVIELGNPENDSLSEVISNTKLSPIEEVMDSEYLEISPLSQQLIDEVNITFENAYSSYLTEIIEIAKEENIFSNEEFNNMIIESANSLLSLDPKNVIAEEKIVSPIQSRAMNINAVRKVKQDNWRLGTKVVRNAGYSNTAMYMKHAEVNLSNGAKPNKHTSKQNAWAKSVCLDNDLLAKSWNAYKSWVYTNKKTLTVSGTHYFGTGDKRLALQNVNWTVVYVRQANGGVTFTVTVTDVYDFEKDKVTYNNFFVNFANNYAVDCTKLNVIAPYPVVVTYTS